MDYIIPTEGINLGFVIEYDGSAFCGFQKQPGNILTVQSELESALSKFANHQISITTAGRTDAGVHALFQVVNFKTTAQRRLHGWQRGINSLIHPSIVVREVAIVPNNFNARFSALNRTYHYYLSISNTRSSILRNKIGYYCGRLDIDKMKLALKYLNGTHDFSSFRASSCQATSPIRTLLETEVEIINNNIICFKLTANAFLYHMVRNIVGTLIYVGNGKLSFNDFKELVADKNRIKAPPTFMPDGLYLANVKYPEPLFKYQVQEFLNMR